MAGPNPGTELDRMEEFFIRQGGGPTNLGNPNGGLANLEASDERSAALGCWGWSLVTRLKVGDIFIVPTGESSTLPTGMFHNFRELNFRLSAPASLAQAAC